MLSIVHLAVMSPRSWKDNSLYWTDMVTINETKENIAKQRREEVLCDTLHVIAALSSLLRTFPFVLKYIAMLIFVINLK